GLSTARQARRMADAARPLLAELIRGDARERSAPRAPCVIDAHYVYPDGVAALTLARELGVPCTVTARGSDLNVLAEIPAVARQIRDAAASAFALLAVSRPLCERFARVVGVAPEHVELVRNGVDLAAFPPGDAREARRRLGLPLEGTLVLGVGRLV